MTIPTTRIPKIWPGLAPPVFRGAGLTHAGRVRERNEDAILTDPEGVFWAIADGMGGYGHGDLASDILIEKLSTLGDDALAGPGLRGRIEEANRAILSKSAEPGMKQMGATLVVAMIQNSTATIGWVGDCRAYLWRSGALRLLTHDHTVVQEMMDEGLLRTHQIEGHPESHVVTRAVGFERDVEVDTVSVPLVSGDRLLMCSDGLTACLGDQDIDRLIAAASDPQALCRALVGTALERGAPDNVSAICVFAEARVR